MFSMLFVAVMALFVSGCGGNGSNSEALLVGGPIPVDNGTFEQPYTLKTQDLNTSIGITYINGFVYPNCAIFINDVNSSMTNINMYNSSYSVEVLNDGNSTNYTFNVPDGDLYHVVIESKTIDEVSIINYCDGDNPPIYIHPEYKQ